MEAPDRANWALKTSYKAEQNKGCWKRGDRQRGCAEVNASNQKGIREGTGLQRWSHIAWHGIQAAFGPLLAGLLDWPCARSTLLGQRPHDLPGLRNQGLPLPHERLLGRRLLRLHFHHRTNSHACSLLYSSALCWLFRAPGQVRLSEDGLMQLFPQIFTYHTTYWDGKNLCPCLGMPLCLLLWYQTTSGSIHRNSYGSYDLGGLRRHRPKWQSYLLRQWEADTSVRQSWEFRKTDQSGVEDPLGLWYKAEVFHHGWWKRPFKLLRRQRKSGHLRFHVWTRTWRKAHDGHPETWNGPLDLQPCLESHHHEDGLLQPLFYLNRSACEVQDQLATDVRHKVRLTVPLYVHYRSLFALQDPILHLRNCRKFSTT